MTINNKYNLGDFVYLLTDTDQRTRVITAIMVNPGSIEYGLRCGTEDSWHFECELSPDRQYGMV